MKRRPYYTPNPLHVCDDVLYTELLAERASSKIIPAPISWQVRFRILHTLEVTETGNNTYAVY